MSSSLTDLTKSIKRAKAREGPRRREPLWKGPEEDGVTFSLLSRFLVCRERFRIHVVEGLAPAPAFNHRLEYGNMWHACEEALACGTEAANEPPWRTALREHCRELYRRFPTEQEKVAHWGEVCAAQFPIYVEYWSRHPDTKDRTPLLQEQVFDVPYRLPSGRTVRLRGKWDSVDLIGRGKGAGVYLQENKTKGDVRPSQLQRQLSFDLQTMLYLVALDVCKKQTSNLGGWANNGINGVRYNVIRRPLSGGRGTIVQHKPSKANPQGESREEFHGRLAGMIRENPEEFFWRWKVEVTAGDVARFRRECLDPILEQLCDWWSHVRFSTSPFESTVGQYDRYVHWRHPFGVWNVLDEGGSSDLDEHLATGSEVGLVRSDSLFPELT